MNRLAAAAVVLTAGVLLSATPAGANVQYLGWADEFVTGLVTCRADTGGGSSNGCTVRSLWAGETWLENNIYDYINGPTWQYLGAQGASATGRANAKSKVMFRFRDSDTATGQSITTTISRYRTTGTGIQPQGGTCSAAIPNAGYASFIGSASQTLDSVGIPAADYKNNMRLLPVYSFSQEIALSGTVVGYLEAITGTGSMGFNGSATKWGCFMILWQ